MFSVWNDLVDRNYSEQDVAEMLELSFPTVGQKLWRAATPRLTFEEFTDLAGRLAAGPTFAVAGLSHEPTVDSRIDGSADRPKPSG